MSDLTVLGLEPADLDGHTVEELAEYLESGREPADPAIEGSPACRMALDALQRLRDLAGRLLSPDGAAGGADQDWIAGVLAAIPVDVRPGRRFPFPTGDPRVSAFITEGAVRGLVRGIGDEITGLLVGSVQVRPGEDPALRVEVAIVYGVPFAAAVSALRRALGIALADHVPFPLPRIDVRVVGLIVPSDGPEQ